MEIFVPQTVLALRGFWRLTLGIGEFSARGGLPGVRSKTMCFTVLGASYLRHSAVEWSVAAV